MVLLGDSNRLVQMTRYKPNQILSGPMIGYDELIRYKWSYLKARQHNDDIGNKHGSRHAQTHRRRKLNR